MSAGEFVSRLIAAGCAPDVAATVIVEAIDHGLSRSADIRRQSVESPTDAAAERRRNADKLRKKAARAADKLARTVCGQSADVSEKRSDLSSLLSNSQSGIREEVSKKETAVVLATGKPQKVSRGTRLDRNSLLSADDRKFALEQGMLPARIDQAWAEFIDYWIGIPGTRGTKLDWSATWRNRVRQISSKTGGPNGSRPYNGNRQSGADAFLAGLAEVAADIRGDGDMAGTATEEIPRGRFNFDG